MICKKNNVEFVPIHSHANFWMPDRLGIQISEDLLSVVSPDIFKEFALPYNNYISEEFNGILLHSCGDFSHNFNNILKHRNLRGINFGVTEVSFPSVVETFKDKIILLAHIGLNSGEKDNIKFNNLIEYIKYVLKNKKERTPLFISVEKYDQGKLTQCLSGMKPEAFNIDEAYKYIMKILKKD